MTRTARLGLALSLALALLCVLVAHARASTEEALRTGLPCSGCHVSPAGGGLRTPAGAAWAAIDRPTFPLGSATSSSPAPPAGAHRRPALSFGVDAAVARSAPPDDPGAGVTTPQAALHLAARPSDPPGSRAGRLTLHAAATWLGSFDAFRFEHYGVIFDDLMLDLALSAGRQGRPSRSAHLDGPGVTGISLHLRPGPLRVWLTAFRPAADPHAPLAAAGGTFGGVLVEWQPVAFVLAGLAFEGGDASGLEVREAAHAGLDFDRAFGWPVRVLSRFAHARTAGGVFGPHTPAHGLSADHTLTSTPLRGLDVSAGYAWADADVDVRYDSSHRVFAAVTWYPVPLLSTALRWQNPWRYGEHRFSFDDDRLFAEVRFGF